MANGSGRQVNGGNGLAAGAAFVAIAGGGLAFYGGFHCEHNSLVGSVLLVIGLLLLVGACLMFRRSYINTRFSWERPRPVPVSVRQPSQDQQN